MSTLIAAQEALGRIRGMAQARPDDQRLYVAELEQENRMLREENRQLRAEKFAIARALRSRRRAA
ncbi:hypothetical protein [Hansschlegelia sp.]|uniref:hypothetical protein n=1 Tax=Hansschlegelia sp. TaxID=2041892 RepID=UPI002BC4B113|nr:hypothetical protein [Hansschlegelia sp.]HVI27504.1 hypothetical protein [Hansschlegelia sp.]